MLFQAILPALDTSASVSNCIYNDVYLHMFGLTVGRTGFRLCSQPNLWMLTCKPCRSPASFGFLLVGLCCVPQTSRCLFFDAMQVSTSNVDSREVTVRPVFGYEILNALIIKA